MNFQKTILAATLTVVGFSANAAETLIEQFAKASNNANTADPAFIYKINNEFYQAVSVQTDPQDPTKTTTEFRSYTPTAGAYENNSIRRGMVDTKVGESSTKEDNKEISVPELFDENGQFSNQYKASVITTTGDTAFNGTITNFPKDSDEPINATILGGSTTVAKTIDNVNSQGYLSLNNGAQVKEYGAVTGYGVTQTTTVDGKATNQNGSTLSSQGLGFYNVDVATLNANGGTYAYDAGTGTLTIKNGTAGSTLSNLDVNVYDDGQARIVQIDGKNFTADAKGVLTEYDTPLTTNATLVAAGKAEAVSNGVGTTETKTAYVGADYTQYGESKQSVTGQGTVYTVGDTNASGDALKQGQKFSTGESTVETETVQYLKSGIIETSEAGDNTYGVKVSKTVNDKETYSTLTESGLKTTGDVTVVNANGSTTSLRDLGTEVGGLNYRVNDLNNRLDDVKKTAYRGVAIALATQQQVPNVKPGQYAVFGGVGQYESETAGALGVVGAINDRTSVSAAVGFAGGSEVGGRVGVSYLFGGN